MKLNIRHKTKGIPTQWKRELIAEKSEKTEKAETRTQGDVTVLLEYKYEVRKQQGPSRVRLIGPNLFIM